MATKSWNDGVADWETPGDWTPSGVPGAGDDVTIATGSPRVINENVGTVDSVTDSSGLILSDGELAVTANVANTGQLLIEPYATTGGGSALTIGGTLSNTGNGFLQIGNGDASGASSVTVNGVGGVTNTGTIEVSGDAPNQATLNIAHAAAGFGTAGHVTGTLSIDGDALVEFASGGITNINAGAQLSLIGTQSRLALASDTTTNSALTGLNENDGTLSLDSTTITTVAGANFTNTGTISIDTPGTGAGNDSGGALTIGGTLSNTGAASIQLGSTSESGTTTIIVEGAGALINTGAILLTGNTTPGTTGQTTLSVANAAAGFGTAGHLTGSVSLNGDALIEFGSGSITNIDAGAELSLTGAQARLAVATGSTTTNSALTGLSENDGTLSLSTGATLTTNAGTNFTNTGTAFIGFNGGVASLSIGGTLTNSAARTTGLTGLNIANGSVSANGLVDTGYIEFFGSAAGASTLAITGGTSSVSGTMTGTGTLALSGGATTISSGAAVTMSNVTLGGAATLEDAAPAAGFTSAIAFTPGASATLKLDAAALPNGQTFANAISGFAAGDTIDLAGLTFAGTVTATETNGVLAVTENGVTDTLSLAAPNGEIFTLKADAGGTGTDVICFAQGTRIRAAHGGVIRDVAIEELQVGDLAVTASDARRPIKWLGHRTYDCRQSPSPRASCPVRVAAHAFGAHLPSADLYLSPGHSVCVNMISEVLIPIRELVNGSTIAYAPMDTVTYWHVELDSHDILIANGLPAESFLEMGENRALLSDEAAPDRPIEVLNRTHADFCRRFVDGGPLLAVAREELARRAEELGWTASRAVGIVGLVGDRRVKPLMIYGETVLTLQAEGAATSRSARA